MHDRCFMLEELKSSYFSIQVCLFSLLLCFNDDTSGRELRLEFQMLRRSLISAFVFQSSSIFSHRYYILVLLIVGESFKTYGNTTSPLRFLTSSATNRSLWREISYVDILYMLLFFSPSLSLLTITMFQCCYQWEKVYI